MGKEGYAYNLQFFYPVQRPGFKKLSLQDKEKFVEIKEKALNVIGAADRSVFIYSSACLPQSDKDNTGTGTLLSKQGDEFLDVIKTYTTSNIIQDLPSGELLPNPPKSFYCAYEGSAESLSPHLISPEILMKEEFGQIVTQNDIDIVVKANKGEFKDIFANFENVVEPDSPFDKLLEKAYKRFNTGHSNDLKALHKEFEDYKVKNENWLEYHGIFEVLSKKYDTPVFDEWPDETDRRLYDLSYPECTRKKRINEILKQNREEIGFYLFKQFMADKCLNLARKKVNEKGLKFGGDVAYQFSLADMFGNPNAFVYEVYMAQPEMKIPALNFYEINDPESQAAKVLKQKIRLAASRYDTLRMDVGWGYVTPILSNVEGTYYEQKEMHDSVLKLIENTVREVKGKDFNVSDIFYEVEAGADDFRAFNEDGSLIEPLKGRMKIYSSNYMNEGWGSNKAYLERFRFSPAEFIYGASNRDTTPLFELASSDVYASLKAQQADVLADVLKIDRDKLNNGDEFIRAKNAEPLTAKNNFMFFTELYGMLRKFNAHDDNGVQNFRLKVPKNPEKAYFDALKNGRGFNLMDAFEKIFVSRGLDKKYPALFSQIVESKYKMCEKTIDFTH